MRACQDYKVVNLWTIEADLAFRQPLPSLLPFVPVLKGGDDESAVRRALRALRADERLSELEPLAGFLR